VTLGVYGGLGAAPGASHTSPVRELVATIAWLGPLAAPLAEDVHDALRSGAAAPDLRIALEQVLAGLPPDAPTECCAELPESIARLVRWQAVTRRDIDAGLDHVRLEDHRGTSSSFRALFRTGQPTIVAFFYTRCDNPFKCTLTVTKLGQVQRLLHARGLGESIRTVGITYDPEFDTPAQLSRYGVDRGLQLDTQHVLVRATAGFDELKRHFALGVSFFESLVSRHRIEVFVLDRKGRVAATFHRLNWSEEQVVDQAARLVEREKAGTVGSSMASLVGLAALAVPKCPLCWATYASVLGLSGVLAFPAPWALQVLAVSLLLVYFGAMLWRAHRTGLRLEHALAVGGGAVATFNTFAVPAGVGTPPLVWVGAGLMACASVLGAARRGKRRLE
jgi:protein SCO1/2